MRARVIVTPNQTKPKQPTKATAGRQSLTGDRAELGVSAYMAACRAKGISQRKAFSAYLCGLSEDMSEVGRSELIARGGALLELRGRWLNMWKI